MEERERETGLYRLFFGAHPPAHTQLFAIAMATLSCRVDRR